jgi:rSAM/selenodomain-associated transferase 1
MTQHLIIFAKAPEPGRVKTRLRWPPEEAARLHGAFIKDTLSRHRRDDRVTTLWRAGDVAHAFWSQLDVQQSDQSDGNLGDRMRTALDNTINLSDDSRAVILGTDSPTLPPQFVDRAFQALDRVPLVLGPACDGGYYLLGMRARVAPIFPADMPWGSDEVLSRTLDLANDAQIPYALLDFWYDIDRPADVLLMRSHLRALSDAQIPWPEHTIDCLKKLDRYRP